MTEPLRHCNICDADSHIREFVPCLLCKLLTHSCNPLLKNANVDHKFIHAANLSGFKFICRTCSPSINSLSVAICNIGVNLNVINQDMSNILKEVHEIKQKQDLCESQAPKNVTTTNAKASFSEVLVVPY